MYIKLIIIIVIVLGIYVGTLEQMRAVMRRQTQKPTNNIEARRNTLKGDVAALELGIQQVRRYIDKAREDNSAEALKAATEAQTMLDKAVSIKQEVIDGLAKADSDTSLQICALRLDMARFHVRNARHLVEVYNGDTDEDEKQGDDRE